MQVEISAGRAFKERAVYTVGPGPVCKCTGQHALEGSVQGGECTLEVQNFLNLFLKLTNQRRPKVVCLVCH